MDCDLVDLQTAVQDLQERLAEPSALRRTACNPDHACNPRYTIGRSAKGALAKSQNFKSFSCKLTTRKKELHQKKAPFFPADSEVLALAQGHRPRKE
eukprot:2654916-Amphidinium_carterae.1